VEDDIREIATSIWETMFSVALEPGDGSQAVGESVVTGCVHIDGAFHGAVTLQCSDGLARRLAGELYQTEAPSPEDVLDTVGELTNMLAGNIKALLAEPSRISLPAVAFGADYALTVMGTIAVSTVGFRSDGLPFVVTLLERQGAGPA
jgi:chemotaxis protein CheX